MDLKNVVCSTIGARYSDLFKLSAELWNNPELAFQEHFAHKTLTRVLEDEGFQVRQHFPLQTSFIASYGTKRDGGQRFGICCEYDALPGIGHGCGHNLIAEAGVAAAIGAKAAWDLIEDNIHELVIIGTPAEENSGGGKIHLIKAGVFNNLDFCMMVHPFNYDVVAPQMLSMETIRFEFRGQQKNATHFSQSPLDAAMAFYSNVSALRQQMRPECRIHGVFEKGGNHPDVWPEEVCLKFMVRAPTDDERRALKKKVVLCATGAAKSTGCTVSTASVDVPYSSMNHNSRLVELYNKNLEFQGLKVEKIVVAHGSSDMGNVSQVVPSIHPKFKIPSSSPTHTKGFADAAMRQEAQMPTLRAAGAMAMTIVDLIQNRS